MTKNQRAYQIGLLRKLHLAPRYINVYKDDPIAYRAFLKKHLGVDSSKELKLDVLIKLVEYFEMKSDEVPTNVASNQQIAYIKHLWQHHATYKDEESLLNFIERILKRALTTLESLTPQDASKVIGGVKKLRPSTIAAVNNPNFKGV